MMNQFVYEKSPICSNLPEALKLDVSHSMINLADGYPCSSSCNQKKNNVKRSREENKEIIKAFFHDM